MSKTYRVSVIGAGAWGTALANAIASPDRPVILYARDAAAAERIAATRINPKLPGTRVDERRPDGTRLTIEVGDGPRA